MVLKVRLELVRELFIVVGDIHVFFKARLEMLLALLARILIIHFYITLQEAIGLSMAVMVITSCTGPTLNNFGPKGL